MLPAIQARPPGTFVGHFLQEFVALGVPEQVKTDNGPAYISQKLHSSFQQRGLSHYGHSSFTNRSGHYRAHPTLL